MSISSWNGRRLIRKWSPLSYFCFHLYMTCTSHHSPPLCKSNWDKFILYLCSTVEGIRSYCPFCLFMQNGNETAIHIFICCSGPWDFTAHALLRTACGKDVFCENCREYPLIENKLFAVSQFVYDWSVSAVSYGPVLHFYQALKCRT